MAAGRFIRARIISSSPPFITSYVYRKYLFCARAYAKNTRPMKNGRSHESTAASAIIRAVSSSERLEISRTASNNGEQRIMAM
jgi:hypothetical protein